MVTVEEVPSLRVVDLKAELKARDLPISGLKAALVDRLVEALKASEAGQTEEPAEAEEAAGGEEPAEDGQADEAAAAVAHTQPDASAVEPEAPAAEPTDTDVAAEPATGTPAEDAAQGDAAVDTPAEHAVPGDAAAAEAPAEPTAAEEEQPTSTADGGQPDEAADEGREVEPDQASDAQHLVDTSTGGDPAATGPGTTGDAAAPADEVQPADAEPDAGGSVVAEPNAEVDAEPAPSAAEASDAPAVEPVAAVAPGPTADGAEPMVEDEAPEMDFDIEPEEEPTAPPSTSKAAKQTGDDTKASRGKREREPIPGIKAPPKVTTDGRQSDAARPAKAQRTESGTPGSAPTRRLSAQSDVPLLTPRQRSSVKAPPPNMEPTPALRIDNFMRPCTLPQVKQLLSQEGAVIKENCFWMNSIKTHCYVIFETAEQAEAIRQTTFNVQFPRDSQKRLAPRFVTVEEAEGVIAGTTSGTPRTPAAPAPAAAPAAGHTPADSSGRMDARRDILERRQQRQQTAKPAPPPQEELGLDDLFRKTETAPHLYWLPVAPKEEVASNNPGPTANGKV